MSIGFVGFVLMTALRIYWVSLVLTTKKTKVVQMIRRDTKIIQKELNKAEKNDQETPKKGILKNNKGYLCIQSWLHCNILILLHNLCTVSKESAYCCVSRHNYIIYAVYYSYNIFYIIK